MFGTPHLCPDEQRSEREIVLHREHEVGFLLPQFMGALASEMSGSRLPDRCHARSGDSLFSSVRGLFMQLRQLRF